MRAWVLAVIVVVVIVVVLGVMMASRPSATTAPSSTSTYSTSSASTTVPPTSTTSRPSATEATITTSTTTSTAVAVSTTTTTATTMSTTTATAGPSPSSYEANYTFLLVVANGTGSAEGWLLVGVGKPGNYTVVSLSIASQGGVVNFNATSVSSPNGTYGEFCANGGCMKSSRASTVFTTSIPRNATVVGTCSRLGLVGTLYVAHAVIPNGVPGVAQASGPVNATMCMWSGVLLYANITGPAVRAQIDAVYIGPFNYTRYEELLGELSR
ncbi:MAG: hypothetical protein QXP98_00870 [Thermoproteus sp.]